ncbi:hypothetical protein [Actinospica robiniae]|uniref:hypothetical protein n=1 Tax=Actinospica robiniae TaxID=304901 RepID=UPI000407563C|nr:hypothetical protein [Actinospica robiniae]
MSMIGRIADRVVKAVVPHTEAAALPSGYCAPVPDGYCEVVGTYECCCVWMGGPLQWECTKKS